MKSKLDKMLCERYPSIFKDRHGNIKNTLMPFGFACGDGWFRLLWELCRRLEKVNPDVVAVQVKEKFGGLRFYVHSANEEGQKCIDRAEYASYMICEWCGQPGTSEGSKRWIRTLCDKCRIKERKGWKPRRKWNKFYLLRWSSLKRRVKRYLFGG